MQLVNPLKKKAKPSKKIPTNKVVIRSPYKLNDAEIREIVSNIHTDEKLDIENKIDKEVIAGVVVHKGTKMVDLSLKGRLQSLKQFIYETS